MTPTKVARIDDAIDDTGSSAATVICNAIAGQTTWRTMRLGVPYNDPSRSAVERVLKEIERSIKTVRIIPMLCERTVEERIAWCEEHLDDVEDPAQLDESYIQISVGNRKVCGELVYPNLQRPLARS